MPRGSTWRDALCMPCGSGQLTHDYGPGRRAEQAPTEPQPAGKLQRVVRRKKFNRRSRIPPLYSGLMTTMASREAYLSKSARLGVSGSPSARKIAPTILGCRFNRYSRKSAILTGSVLGSASPRNSLDLTLTHTWGSARMFRYQSALVPREDPTTMVSSISSYCRAVTRARPVFRPRVVSSRMRRPTIGPKPRAYRALKRWGGGGRRGISSYSMERVARRDG